MKRLVRCFFPILLAITLVLGSCLTVSAATTSNTSGSSSGKPFYYPLPFNPSDFSAYVVLYRSASNERLAYCLSDGGFIVNSEGYLSVTSSGKYRIYSFDGNSWGTGSSINSYISGQAICLFSHGVAECSENIYDSTGKLVFQVPVRPLVGAVMGAAPEKTLKEIILLIPLSIPFLAGCLGLRKALRLVLSILRKA